MQKKEKIKAVGLFSGGLDSALAIRLIQEQGIEVIALNFVSLFCTCTGGGCSIVDLAKKLGVPIKTMNKGEEYMKIIRHPKHGYGKNMNPCIDCRIFILEKAKEYAKEIGAKFIFTGEVLGQRPMSQHYETLLMIEKEVGLSGKIVRPLCAGLMPPTEAEEKGWISREQLLKFNGRSRAPQLDLAKRYAIDGFMCGGSGCRLTDPGYAKRIRDLFAHGDEPSMKDIKLLAFGRHFRIQDNKIIVGRNEQENDALLRLRDDDDMIFEAKGVVGPVTILVGKPSEEAKALAAALTARYSDSKEEQVLIRPGAIGAGHMQEILSKKISDDELKKYMIL
ncbi:MAG: hypothetical protein V1866_02045 [archaeon]